MKTDLTVSAYIIKDKKILLVDHVKTGLWLPPGGHIEKNETPDDALRREIKQELNLEIKILNTPKIPKEGNIMDQLAVPFYCDTHWIIDHINYCSFYLCEPTTEEIRLKKDEIKAYTWFEKERLFWRKISADVRNIGLLAFKKYNELIK